MEFEAFREALLGKKKELSGAGLVSDQDGQLLAVEFQQQLQQVAHEPCFSLHVMQSRDHGIAFNLASAIGSPQSRQTP